MANPFHDETGRFCSKGEMGEAVERVYQTMVSTSSGPAQEEAANAWFNLRNEFEATKKQELDEQRPDNLKLGQKNPERKANSSLLGSAQATLDQRTADNFARYTLPKGAMGFGSQDERYAQVVSTTAIHVLIDKAQQSPYVTSHASAKNVKDMLEKALGTFTEESGQTALKLSLARTQEILDKHTRDHALASGGLQARIDVIPAIHDLEFKAIVTDVEDPNGKNKDLSATAGNGFVPSAATLAKEAEKSFDQRASNLSTYEIPTGLHVDSSSAATHVETLAQDVTRSAIANVLNARSLVNENYAPYSEVRRRLVSNFADREDGVTVASIARANAILKRESSLQELHEGKRDAYVNVKAALRALEDKGLTVDLADPAPAPYIARNVQQRENTKAVRAARHAAPEEIPAEGRLTSETEAARRWREAQGLDLPNYSDPAVQKEYRDRAEASVTANLATRSRIATERDEMNRLFTEDPDEFYRRNRANAFAKAEEAEKSGRRPPRFIPRSEKRGPDVTGPR